MLIWLSKRNQHCASVPPTKCQQWWAGWGRRRFCPQDGRLEAASSIEWASEGEREGSARYTSNQPAGVSAKGNNQRWLRSAKRHRPAGQIYSLHRSLIELKCSTVWFILKEQSGLYVTGLCIFFFLFFFRIGRCWFVSNDGWNDGLLSGLPAHQNVTVYPSSFLSSASTAHLAHNLSVPVISVCLRSGQILLPWPPSRTNMHVAPEFVWVCVTCSACWYCQVTCHPLIIVMFLFCFFSLQQLRQALAVVAKRPSSLFLIAPTSNCRRAQHGHTY